MICPNDLPFNYHIIDFTPNIYLFRNSVFSIYFQFLHGPKIKGACEPQGT